jgi:putative methylase
MRLRQLEIVLEGLGSYRNPTPHLEQYQTPAPLAARLLHQASMEGAIDGRSVCDLGCGTGILAIGAAILGGDPVFGVDIDEDALRIARQNAVSCEVNPEFIQGDLRDHSCVGHIPRCDTVVMNPPFGAQTAHADRSFIDAALVVGQVCYGIFNAGSRTFIEGYVQGRATLEEVVSARFPIKRTFSFHTREVREIDVEIIRFRRRES